MLKNKIKTCYVYAGYPITSQNVQSLLNEDEAIHLDSTGIEFDYSNFSIRDCVKVHIFEDGDIVQITRANKQICFQLRNEEYLKKMGIGDYILLSRCSGIPKDKNKKFTFLMEVEKINKSFILTNNKPVLTFEGEPTYLKRGEYILLSRDKDLIGLDVIDEFNEDSYIILSLRKRFKKINVLVKCLGVSQDGDEVLVSLKL